MDADLLRILCCPETHQELHVAPRALVDALNRLIANGTLKNRAGHSVTEKLDAGLLRTDQKVLYPIRNNLPVMLVDEAIALPS